MTDEVHWSSAYDQAVCASIEMWSTAVNCLFFPHIAPSTVRSLKVVARANIDPFERSEKKEYQDEAVRQLILWVNGVRRHNFITNECCPDFSCCTPELFEEDFTVRRAKLRRYLVHLGRLAIEPGR